MFFFHHLYFVCGLDIIIASMNGENRRLVIYELVELKKQLVQVQDFMKITDHSRGIYGIFLK